MVVFSRFVSFLLSRILSELSLHCFVLADSGVVRIDPLRFLAGCRKKRLNQALFSLLA